MTDLLTSIASLRRDPGFGPVESYDRCTGPDPCAHCAAGRPAAPGDLGPRDLYCGVWELDEEVRRALPPAFHRPEFIDTCTPKGWFCNCCWGDGTLQQWPCDVAQAHGAYVQRVLHHERDAVRRLTVAVKEASGV